MNHPTDGIVEPSGSEMHRFLEDTADANIFQTPEMYDLYSHARGCKPWLRGVCGPDGGIRSSLLSTAFVDAPGVKHVSIRGGPLFDPDPASEKTAVLLLTEHERRFRISSLYSRIYPLRENAGLRRTATRCGFRWTPWVNYVVDVSTIESEGANLPKDRRRGIRKAENAGLGLRDAETRADVDDAVRLLRLSAERGRYPLQHPSLFHAVRDSLVPARLAKIVLARLGDKNVAARVLLTYRDTVYDWYAGSDPEYRHLQPDTWLVWRVLSWARADGFALFDFGGAGDPAVPYGPREFKKRFGGLEVQLGRATHYHYPRVTSLLTSLRDTYQSSGTP